MTAAERDIIAILEAIEAAGTSSGSDATKADKTVAGKYRIKTDGTFQLYNPTTSKYHTLSLSGADGAVVLAYGAGES